MGADEAKIVMESGSPGRTVDPTLRQEVLRAFLDSSERSVVEIDELLTRCAGETLRLQAERTRTESAVRALESERLRLFELTARVRALRDRVRDSKRGS